MIEYKTQIEEFKDPVCRVFGAGSLNLEKIKIKKDDIVIAADGGFKHLMKFNIKPHVLLGDFDSLNDDYTKAKNSDLLRFASEKDDTDSFLAIKEGIKRGYKTFAFYGCLNGPRISHAIANIQGLIWLLKRGMQGFIIDKNINIFVAKDGVLKFSKNNSGYISIFAISNKIKSLTISNLKYQITNLEISSDFPLGVSNSFIGKDSKIIIKDGTALVIVENV